MPAIGGAAWSADATAGAETATSAQQARNHRLAWRARAGTGGIPRLRRRLEAASCRWQRCSGPSGGVNALSWHNLRSRRPQLRRTTPSLVAIALLFTAAASAQEMEPRPFSPSPVGTNFVVFAVNHASGSVLVDPSLPVTDIHASNTVNVLGLGHVFDLFGRQALVTGVLPYANAE